MMSTDERRRQGRLRPVEERDLDALGRIDTDPSVSEPFEWRGLRDWRARRRRWEEDGYLGSEDSLLVVALPDGTAAGIVVWKSIAASGPPGCLEIGTLLFPDHRGKGVGTAAQRLLADHLFSTTVGGQSALPSGGQQRLPAHGHLTA
jgi:[ribosomal protein S5]-alanine N-acetyltransferase